MKIVIVEDEIRIREGLMKLLERIDQNYQVVGEAEKWKSRIRAYIRKQTGFSHYRRANAYHGRPRDAALPAGKAALAEGHHSQRVF